MRKKAFTLIEILIVIAVLGILAALVIPQFQDYSQKAKEANAKANLKILRDAIERYAAQHGGVAPGYPNDDIDSSPSYMSFGRSMTDIEHHLSKMPENPFNNIRLMKVLKNDEAFPTEPTLPNFYGWIYKPATKTIKLNWPGTDSSGVAYFDY